MLITTDSQLSCRQLRMLVKPRSKAAFARTKFRIPIRSGWVLGDQDKQANPTGSFLGVFRVLGVTASPLGCGLGHQAPGLTGHQLLSDEACTWAVCQRPRAPHPAGHRRGRAPAAGRERLPPASVALLRARRGCKLRGLASGHRGLSRLAACKMLGAGRWATTHRRCLPGGTWFLGTATQGLAELTKRSGPCRLATSPATCGSRGARWDIPVQAPRPPASTRPLTSPPSSVCCARPTC